MERKILAFMKENGVALFAEADRATGDIALFFDSQLSGAAFTKWVRELDQKVRGLY